MNETMREDTYLGWEEQMLRTNASNENKEYTQEKARGPIFKIFTDSLRSVFGWFPKYLGVAYGDTS